MKAATAGLLLLIGCLAASAPAAVSGPEAVVVGKVEESRTIVHRKARSALYYLRLKVAVESVESGRELIRGAKEIEVRCWQEMRADASIASGQRRIPADGTRFRARLARHRDGFFEPVGLEAFRSIDGSSPRQFPVPVRRQSTTRIVVGGFVGLLALVAGSAIHYRRRATKDRVWGSE